MQNTFIKTVVGVPALTINSVSKPTFFCDEKTGVYRATVDCYDGDTFICAKETFFTQEEYDAWGTDNTYIYNLIYTKLNFEIV